MPKLPKTAADNSSYVPSYSSSLPRSVTDCKGPVQIFYEDHSRALKILIVMFQELHNNCGDAIFAETEQLWKGIKNTSIGQ